MTQPQETKEGWKDNMPLAEQLNRLTDFIFEKFPNEIGKDGRSEGAIECAVRLLGNLHQTEQRVAREILDKLKYPLRYLWDQGSQSQRDLLKLLEEIKHHYNINE